MTLLLLLFVVVLAAGSAETGSLSVVSTDDALENYYETVATSFPSSLSTSISTEEGAGEVEVDSGYGHTHITQNHTALIALLSVTALFVIGGILLSFKSAAPNCWAKTHLPLNRFDFVSESSFLSKLSSWQTQPPPYDNDREQDGMMDRDNDNPTRIEV